jgi:hypothetical protein
MANTDAQKNKKLKICKYNNEIVARCVLKPHHKEVEVTFLLP